MNKNECLWRVQVDKNGGQRLDINYSQLPRFTIAWRNHYLNTLLHWQTRVETIKNLFQIIMQKILALADKIYDADKPRAAKGDCQKHLTWVRFDVYSHEFSSWRCCKENDLKRKWHI